MKKLLSFLFLLAAVASLSAQSVSYSYDGTPLSPRDTIVCTLDTGLSSALVGFAVTNNDAESHSWVASAIPINPNGMSFYGFCAEFCSEGDVSAPFTVEAGATYNIQKVEFTIPNTLVPSTEGLFCIMVSDTATAKDTMVNPYVFVKVIVEEYEGIESAAQSSLLAAYPNPATDQLSIPYAIEENNNAAVMIFNCLGVCVRELALQGTEGTLQTDVSSLPAGVYTYALRNAGSLSPMQKLVVK